MKTAGLGRAGWLAAGLLMAFLAVTAAPAVFGAPDVSKKAASQLKLAQTYFDAGRLAEALGTVDKALAEESRYSQAHLLRGMILHALGKMDEALKEFDRTLSLDRKYTDARIYRGSALANLKRYDEAMTEFRKAQEDLSYPWPERILVNIGMLHREQGRSDEAIENLRRAVALNPSHAKGYYELGVTYEKQGRDTDAVRAYQDALVGMDNSPDLHLKLGMALKRVGNGAKAREHFERVTALAPDGPA
ncbi:MAG TPA: tetratricopeptide repeat protein, partial [Candidatus Polarisedimenticolia bacterium]|nr:tetratricopeptide repeat protein [Candidatus Polarisedimenticolia bacterium]